MHIYKARELLFAESRLIACPLLEPPYAVLAIMQRELLDGDSFKNLVQQLKLVVCWTRRPVPAQYQTCLAYTLLAVVAPAWNRVGPFLCEGRNFLVETGPLSAVEWELLVTERESRLMLTAVVIRLEQMTLSHLLGVSTVDPVLYHQLRTSEVAIRPVSCYVLPSMKTASAVAVSFAPPPGWEYSSFLDLKIYWKNTYGYHIPEESESTMAYVKVCFRVDSRFYVYPILCVRPKLPQPLMDIDPNPILDKFMECVNLL